MFNGKKYLSNEILNSITIGNTSIAEANSVVNMDVPSYSVVAGIPGKVVKKLL
jgi:serine acetyltransferase